MIKKSLVFIVLSFIFTAVSEAAPVGRAVVADHDPLMIWKRSRSFEKVKQEGAQVVIWPEKNNFFAYYIPPGYASGRIMVAVHGTGGNPYEELKDEIPMARTHDYMVVAMNWYKPKTGFFKAEELYGDILQALSFIQKKTGNDLSRVGYIGFSRGSAVSYEVAYLDAKNERIIDIFISHSGGIPRNFKIEAKSPGAEPDEFFKMLALGQLGEAPLKGAQFFLYSGDKDESWGPTMSEQMEYANELIPKNGGQVLEWVRRADLGHMGFRQDKTINEKALRYFIEVTP